MASIRILFDVFFQPYILTTLRKTPDRHTQVNCHLIQVLMALFVVDYSQQLEAKLGLMFDAISGLYAMPSK